MHSFGVLVPHFTTGRRSASHASTAAQLHVLPSATQPRVRPRLPEILVDGRAPVDSRAPVAAAAPQSHQVPAARMHAAPANVVDNAHDVTDSCC